MRDGMGKHLHDDTVGKSPLPSYSAASLAGDNAHRPACGRMTQADPATLFEQLRSELDFEHARRTRQLKALWDETARLVSELAASPPAMAPVRPILQPHAVPLVVLEQISNAKSNVALIHLETDHTARNSTEFTMSAKLRALERDIDLRVIYPPALLIQPVLRQKVARQLEAGAKVRTTPAPTVQMFLCDGRSAVLTRSADGGPRHAVLVGESILVSVLYLLFDAWWAEAKDVAPYLADPAAADPVTEMGCEERVLLQLLGDGLTDETVAHKLGISVRTVRRRVAVLLRHIEADSRFQAGVLVAKRGWL